MNESVDMDTVSWLIASEYRLITCETLGESMATPTGIEDETGFELTHVSRSLGQLKDKGLAELQSAEGTKKGRIYSLTEKGEAVLEQAQKVKR